MTSVTRACRGAPQSLQVHRVVLTAPLGVGEPLSRLAGAVPIDRGTVEIGRSPPLDGLKHAASSSVIKCHQVSQSVTKCNKSTA